MKSRVFQILIMLSLLSLSACKDLSHHVQGYIEDSPTYITSATAGRLVQLTVVRGQTVK